MAHSYSCDECKKPIDGDVVYERRTLYVIAPTKVGAEQHYHWQCFLAWAIRMAKQEGVS